MTGDKPAAIDVLLVEDSPGDVRLTLEAFRSINDNVRLHVTVDGVDAMAFLQREGPYAEAPRPDIILLDLNLPRMDGREVPGQTQGGSRAEADPDRHPDHVGGARRHRQLLSAAGQLLP
jgi:DNA-binding NarL/FixJ family response regulator